MSSFHVLLGCVCILLLTARVCSATPELSWPVLRVTSILSPSFLSRADVDGSEQFVGFIPDLLEGLSRWVGFDYEIRLVRDGRYGSQMPDGKWNGMIGELIRGEADVAAAALTVTSLRERVIGFTKPFMGHHIAAVMKKSHSTQLEIHAVRDLARQSTIKYGVLDSAAKDFFQSSPDPDYARMWREMEQDGNSSWVGTVEEGLERVMASTDEQPWAFLANGALFSGATVQQRCDMQVVLAYDVSLPVSLATTINSPYRDRITLGILEMLESNEIAELRNKWFPPPVDCDHPLNGVMGRFLLPLH